VRVSDLGGKNVVIFGLGREGKAAAAFLRTVFPNMPLTFVDEAAASETKEEPGGNTAIVRKPEAIAAALDKADVVIKSPGVSLYHPLINSAVDKGTPVTSLLNLWLAEPRKATVIGITGTKGKSTTAALLVHVLNALGKKAVLAGNIGVPVTEAPQDDADFIVIEISSYQAADIEGDFPIGVLTSLYPEHLDWHQSLEVYYRDKLNLLRNSRVKIVNAEALETMRQHDLSLGQPVLFNDPSDFHAKDSRIYDKKKLIGALANKHLSRPYNLSNVCAVLAALKQLGFDLSKTLAAMEDFRGLPHRQQELGEKDGVLYVDDSISTMPQSAIAAMESYGGKSVTLIAGGFDRGIDYAPLADYVTAKKIHAVICMGPSGQRIYDLLTKAGGKNVFAADSMQEAVGLAKERTPEGGVVLLSPAAPSYGLFKNFEERGKAFAAESGFAVNPASRDNV
jgi:UDP-N-acetylmuramoyl-L-alanine---L-glutamate ligase